MLDVHVAAAVDANGGVLGVESFATTPAGLRELHGWLAGFGTVDRVGVEGTGAYGAGLARYLRGRGSGGDRGRSSEPAGASPQRQVRRARRDRSGAGGVVGPGVGDREVRGWRRRSDPGVVGRATFGPRRADQVLESDPPSRLHRTRRAAGTAAGRAPRPAWRAPRRRCDPPPAATRSCTRRSSRSRRWVAESLALEADAERLDDAARDAGARAPRRACSRSTASGSTPPRSCWSPPATTRIGSAAKPRSRICVASRRSRRRRERPTGIDSTPAGTAKRTMRCGGSCSPA